MSEELPLEVPQPPVIAAELGLAAARSDGLGREPGECEPRVRAVGQADRRGRVHVEREAAVDVLKLVGLRRAVGEGGLDEELDLVGWRVSQRLGLLSRKLQAPADRPGGGEVGDEGEDLPTASLRSGRLRRRALGACGSLSRYHRTDPKRKKERSDQWTRRRRLRM